VKRACELLQVSRSAYYADRARRAVPRVQRDVELTGELAGLVGAGSVLELLQKRPLGCSLGHARTSLTQDVYMGWKAKNPPAAAALETAPNRSPEVADQLGTVSRLTRQVPTGEAPDIAVGVP
jgi:hypothetical protein